MTGDDHERLSLRARRLGPAFERRVVVIPPGQSHRYDEAEWRDALVVVERGQVELECLGGSRQHLECGDVLWLEGLPLVALSNHGSEPAVLVAVSRASRPDAGTTPDHPADEFPADPPSQW